MGNSVDIMEDAFRREHIEASEHISEEVLLHHNHWGSMIYQANLIKKECNLHTNANGCIQVPSSRSAARKDI